MEFLDWKMLAGLASIGMAATIGKLLESGENLTVGLIIGRALVGGALGASAAAILIWFPAVPYYAQMGLAAIFGSLGTSGLEAYFKRKE